ncbi:bifunctional nuclease family protein [Microbacterium sp. P06]|uniref:bifunctional nuclease family protein n=1 Tax=Microbacterium sp. P06 TaxID=3366949 RepID=UPI0037471D40
MVQVRVIGVARDTEQQHVILLKPVDEPAAEGRMLPVWIGEQEATSILVAVQGAQTPRPLAHDLMAQMIHELEAEVDRVEVTRLEEGTYFAEITLFTPHGMRVIDARPSDAIALASRTHTPIWVADDVLEIAGVEDTVSEPAADEEQLDEFRRFLDDVDPEDFQA